MRALKYLAFAIGVIALLLVAAVIYVNRLDPEVYKAYVVDAVHKAIGREAHIDGDAEVNLLPVPALRLENVRLANASWASEPDMLTLERLDLRLALRPLLSGHVRVDELLLTAPVVNLEVDEKGRPNWELGRTDAKPVAKEGFAFSLASVSVRDGAIRYRERPTGREIELTVEEFSAREEPQGLAVRLRSSYRDQPVRLEGKVGSVATLLVERPFPLDLQGSVGGIALTVKGAVRTEPNGRGFQLALETSADSPDTLAQLTDAELPAVGPLRASFEVSGVPQAFEAHNVDIAAGESRVAGNLKLDLGAERPSATGALSAAVLDVDAFLPEARKKVAEKEANERLFPADPLPFDVLPAWDIDVRLTADRARFQKVTLEDVTLPIDLRAGRLTISPETTLARGRFTGKLSVATETEPPAITLQVRGRDFEVGELSHQIRGIELSQGGKATLDIDVEGRGSSVREIMAGLNGRLEFHQRESQIRTAMLDRAGGDILTQVLSVIIPGGEKKEMTRLECVVVRFGLREGVAVADKTLAAQTTKVNLVGGGTINLKDETLDVGAHLSARKGIQISAGSLASLVRLRGPLTNPQVGTDLTGVTVAGAKAAGAFATGGLSLIAQKVYGQLIKQPDPCEQALAAELPTGKATAAAVEGAKEPTTRGEADSEKEAAPPKKTRKSLLKELLGQ
ncbi:MAG: AsmA family protein [Gammaproteobacteria bacterium]|nr:AsmA family protein [Gammaproteobacteria bacterium]NIR85749.1 AsmA family protein [Gammaproteobacteria bacterium]NIR90282.1 AsmA family protein [Gammaproteobacteria bacterium]NIU06883.1 AsmA family protein [Gammaproteobacteria bacterium]NIV53816.1 AsmA family protein [Gammaproteobacteria bacterium]